LNQSSAKAVLIILSVLSKTSGATRFCSQLLVARHEFLTRQLDSKQQIAPLRSTSSLSNKNKHKKKKVTLSKKQLALKNHAHLVSCLIISLLSFIPENIKGFAP